MHKDLFKAAARCYKGRVAFTLFLRPISAVFYVDCHSFAKADIGMPNTKTEIFLRSEQDPKRRLAYRLRGDEMSEKFQILLSGMTEFKSYLEWSGTKM